MPKVTSAARSLRHPWAFPAAAIISIVCAYVWLQSAVGEAAFAILTLLLLAALAFASKLARIVKGHTGAIRPTTVEWRSHLLGFTLDDRAASDRERCWSKRADEAAGRRSR
jgi:hypothetical protein